MRLRRMLVPWSAAILVLAAAPCAGAESSRQLFKGRLVGTQFRNAATLAGLASLSLQFLLIEDYHLALGEEGTGLLWGRVPGTVDVAALTPENFASTIDAMIRSTGATGVQLGGECLVEVEWTGVDRKLVSLERFDEKARAAFLERHAEYLIRHHGAVVAEFDAQCRQQVDLAIASARAKRGSSGSVAGASADGDPTLKRLAAWESLQMARKMAAASRLRLESSAAILAKLRDAANPAVRAKVEPILAQVPARLKVADECEALLVAAIAEDPREAIDRDLNAASPPATRPTEPKR